MPEDDAETKPTTIAGFTPVGATDGIGHLLSPRSPDCPKCGSHAEDHEVRDYDPMVQDGNVYCLKCGAYIRYYDAG